MFGPARLTCGGGGAYTAGTHHLPPALDPHWSAGETAAGPPLFQRYPSKSDSRRLRWGVFWALVGRLSFVFTAGAIGLLLAASLVSDDATESTSTIDRLRDATLAEVPVTIGRGLLGNPLAFALWSLVAGGVFTFALGGRRKAGWMVAVGAGIIHAAAQLSAMAVALWLLVRIDAPGVLSAFCAGATVWLVGGVVAALLAGAYLLITDQWELHPDIVFAVQGRTQYKSFVRLHVDRHGDLDMYAYGIPRVVSMWRPNPSAGPCDPILIPTGADESEDARPEQPPHVELIERLHFAARSGPHDA